MEEIVKELRARLDASKRSASPDVDQISDRYGLSHRLEHLEEIHCADGFRMSVQASGSHYCTPRDNFGPWHTVEVGFPSEKVESFMDYTNGVHRPPTETVYGYVPLTTVADVILLHGGFAS